MRCRLMGLDDEGDDDGNRRTTLVQGLLLAALGPEFEFGEVGFDSTRFLIHGFFSCFLGFSLGWLITHAWTSVLSRLKGRVSLLLGTISRTPVIFFSSFVFFFSSPFQKHIISARRPGNIALSGERGGLTSAKEYIFASVIPMTGHNRVVTVCLDITLG